MGIPGLWKKLGNGETIDIATFAARHFEEAKRPSRIAVDEASWRYNCYVPDEQVAQSRRGGILDSPHLAMLIDSIVRANFLDRKCFMNRVV